MQKNLFLLLISLFVFCPIQAQKAEIEALNKQVAELTKEKMQLVLENEALKSKLAQTQEYMTSIKFRDSIIMIYEFDRFTLQLQDSIAQAKSKAIADSTTAAEAARIIAEKSANSTLTSVIFNEKDFNFTNAKDGDIITHRFSFENTGNRDLILTNVKPSCGCTTPTWSDTPVKPGEKGFIDIKFDTAGKVGIQVKTITVTGNFEGEENVVLRVMGEVLAKSKKK